MNSPSVYASSALSIPSLLTARLLARHSGKQTIIKRLSHYLYDVSAAVGISTRIVPDQLRHTYASEMVRAGVS